MGADREIRVDGHRVVRAPLHRVWQLLSRLESHPRYAGLWLSADLLERSQAAALVEFSGFFGGLPVVSVQRMLVKPPGRIEFKQVRGTLRGLSGAYLLRDAGGETDLTITMAADPGIALFSETSVRQILAGHIEGTLGRIKASAERDLVRLPTRRPPGAARPRPPDGSETEEPAGEEPAEEEPQAVATDAVADEAPEAGSGGPEPLPGEGTPAEGVGPQEPNRRRRRRRRRGPRPPAGRPPA